MDQTLFFEMAPAAPIKKKTGSKPKSKPVEKGESRSSLGPVEARSSEHEEDWEDEDDGDESESDEEDDGVDEVGFEKLIKALGDDGLNEYDQAHLVALDGDEESEEEDMEGQDIEEDDESAEVPGSEEDEEVPDGGDGAGEEGPGTGSEVEEGESSDNEDPLALDELEDVELHPDAVPRRGVKVIDNKVCITRVSCFSYLILHSGCTREDKENHPARS